MAAQYELLKELLNSGTKLDFGAGNAYSSLYETVIGFDAKISAAASIEVF